MVGSKKCTFSCPDTPKWSFKYFQGLKNKKELCDLTLQIGSESVSAHRIIITAVIPYFRGILKSKNEKDISVPDIDPKAFKSLVEFAYTCEVEIAAENVRNLLAAACYLGVDVVRDACFDYLADILEHENVLHIRDLAETFNCAELLECADCYIRRNFEKVCQTQDFMQCPSSHIKELISRDDVNVDNEEKIFEAVLKWVKHSPEERSIELPELMRRVRMPQLQPFYLTKTVQKEEIIRASLLCRDLIDEAGNYNMFPELRKSICSFMTEPRESSNTTGTKQNKSRYIFTMQGEIKLAVQYFDLVKKEWRTKKASTFLLNGGSLAEVDGKVYFFYRGNTKEYNPYNNVFRNLDSMETPRIYTTATAFKHFIYVCGGKKSSLPSNAVERFDRKKNKWTGVNCMQVSCWGSSSVTLGEYIFVLGGTGNTSVHDEVQRYDPVLDKWEIMSSLLEKRFGAGAATLSGKIYICGGYIPSSDTSLTVSATAEVYDPILNRSAFISPTITARTNLTLLSRLGKLYAVGGKDNHRNPVKTIDVYDAEDDEWLSENLDD